MTWEKKQDWHSQCPIEHTQYVRTGFVHPTPLHTYCWYFCLAEQFHFWPVHFLAWGGALASSCSVPLLLALFFLSSSSAFFKYSLLINSHANLDRKSWNFMHESGCHTKKRIAKNIFTSVHANKYWKTRTGHLFVTQVSSKEGILCRSLLWSSTMWRKSKWFEKGTL